MMSCGIIKYLHPPTAIHNAVYCYFFNKREKSLVVTGLNFLHVYRLNLASSSPYVVSREAGAPFTKSVDDDDDALYGPSAGATNSSSKQVISLSPENVRLECLAMYELFGTIVDIKAASLPSSNRDLILLTFADAKLSAVQYDPIVNDLRSISLHDYEAPKFSDEMPTNLARAEPTVRVDPDGRCAVMRLYRTQLAVIPFTQSPTRSDNSLNGPKPVTQFRSFAISVKKIKDDPVEFIQDFQMLPGYLEPTVAVLCHKTLSWVGRIAVSNDTCYVAALSLNTKEKSFHVIWNCMGLPYDSSYMQSVPRPIGGLLVISTSAIIYVNQGVPSLGVSLNGATTGSTRFPLRVEPTVVATLDGSRCSFFEPERMLLSLRNGNGYVITVVYDHAMRNIREFHWQQVLINRYASCITPLEGGFIFVGGKLSDSVLYSCASSPWIEADAALVEDDPMNGDSDKRGKNFGHVMVTFRLRYTFMLETDEARPSRMFALRFKRTVQSMSAERPVKEREDAAFFYDRLILLYQSLKVLPNNYTKILRLLQLVLGLNLGLKNIYTSYHCRKGAGQHHLRRTLLQAADDEDIYGPNAFVSIITPLRKYHFTICDTVLNIGPCRTSAVGEPVNSLEDFARTPDKDADIVTSSGYENESYACALHRTIRPDVVASFDLPNATDLWTLYDDSQKMHTYVVISTVDKTAVFQSDEEIVEAEEHPFQCDDCTLYCCQVQNGRVSIQITRTYARIASAANSKTVYFTLDEDEEVKFAMSVNERFIFLTNGGMLMVYVWDNREETIQEINTSGINFPDNGILGASLYLDRSGLFTNVKPANVGSIDMAAEPDILEVTTRAEAVPEDEDELLYGPRGAAADSSKEKQVKTAEDLHKFLVEERLNVNPYGPSDWLLVIRRDHSMAIYTVPDLIAVFETHPIIHAPRVIHDVYSLELPPAPVNMVTASSHELRLREVLLIGLGSRQMQPYLFLVINEDVYIYHVVPFYYGVSDMRLRICFSRVKHEMLTRERRLKRRMPKDLHHDDLDHRLAKRFVRPFSNVLGYSGVFLCFPYPYFVMVTDKNILRFHPMVVDGPVKAFAEFRNASCKDGFLYYNSHKQIRVAELEPFWNYDFHWPLKKVKVPGTIHYISYHLECKTYIICSAVYTPEKRMIHGGVDAVEIELIDGDPRFVYPLLPKFSIHVITPDEWQLVPDASYSLQDFEHVTAMKVLPLKNGTETGMKEYVVITTNFAYGEDVQSRGRIILLDVLDVVAEPEQPLSRFKQKEIYAEEQKGPVTALCGVNGYIVSAIGQKVFIWGLKGSNLVGVAFLDVQIYVHQLSSIKDLVLVADIQRSISIIRFQEKYRTLSLVSSDPNQMHTYAAEFCVDNQSLTVAVTDIQQDLHIFQFDPDYYFSAFGNRLVRKMECNLGQYVTNLFRFRSSAFYPDAERVAAVALTKKHLTMFTTLDGAIGCFMNIPEKTYRRILMIETILSNHVIHRAGLSPRLYWNARTSGDQRFDLVGNIKTIADGKVGSLYLELDHTEKHEVAMKIGCSVDALVEELLDIDRQTAVF